MFTTVFHCLKQAEESRSQCR